VRGFRGCVKHVALLLVLACWAFAPSVDASQHLPNGLKRVFALQNPNLDIDNVDDYRVDVDVAILDSGIDLDHPDLDVVRAVDCTQASAPAYACDEGAPGDGDDSHGHGTAAAGRIGAIDNDYGVVGVAPGARLWSVDILNDQTFDQEPATTRYDGVVAGVKWVAAHADEIEVAKIIACAPSVPPPSPTQGTCPSGDDGAALEQAIDDAIDAGVVVVVGMGPPGAAPSHYDDVLAVSPIADFDGLPGSLVSSPGCQGVPDTFNVGEIDDSSSGVPASVPPSVARILAPGYCTGTTTHTGGYSYGALGSAPSVAMPHVAGAAALLASADNPDSRGDVESIIDSLIESGNQDWIDELFPADPRPLLDLHDDTVFAPLYRPGLEHDVESDVDGDGHADIVGVSPDGGAYTYRGDGGYRFDGSPPVESLRIAGFGMIDPALFDGVGLSLVDVADVTGDRRDDLIAVGTGGTVAVAPALASGGFDTKYVASLAMTVRPALLAPGGHEPVAVADVSGDGHGDLIAFNDISGKLMVYPGSASGAFVGPGIEAAVGVTSALHTGTGEYFVDAADVTGDRRADLLSLRTTDDSIVVRPGKLDGSFAPPVASRVGLVDAALDDAQGYEPAGVGDVDGDGRADLVLLKDNWAYMFPAAVGGTFGAPVTSFVLGPTSGQMPSSLFGASAFEVVGILDVNGDTRADFVYFGPGGNGNVAEALPTGAFIPEHASFSGTFRSTQHFRNQNATGRELVIEKPAARRRGCQPTGC
jgi:hypothetical protein